MGKGLKVKSKPPSKNKLFEQKAVLGKVLKNFKIKVKPLPKMSFLKKKVVEGEDCTRLTDCNMLTDCK